MTSYGFLNIVGPVGHNVIFLLVGGKVCDGIDSFMPHICLSLRITEDHRGVVSLLSKTTFTMDIKISPRI